MTIPIAETKEMKRKALVIYMQATINRAHKSTGHLKLEVQIHVLDCLYAALHSFEVNKVMPLKEE